MLLGDSTQTPSIRLRVVFLNQLASPALVFTRNLTATEMATPVNRQPSRATIRLRPTLRFLGWGTSKLPSRLKINKAPQVGLEPTTLRLTAGCSAIELLRSNGTDGEFSCRRDQKRLTEPERLRQFQLPIT